MGYSYGTVTRLLRVRVRVEVRVEVRASLVRRWNHCTVLIERLRSARCSELGAAMEEVCGRGEAGLWEGAGGCLETGPCAGF